MHVMSDKKRESRGAATAAAGTEQQILDHAIRLHKGGRLKEAEAAYRELLRLQPGHPAGLHMLGVLAHQGGRHEEAISLMNSAMTHAPSDAGLHTNLGTALQACGRLDEAVASFMRAIELDPRSALAHNNLGNALRLQGKHEQAVAAYRRALDIDNRYTDAYVNLAIAYQTRGELEKAAHYYEKAVGLDPDHRPAAHMLAALRGESPESAPSEHVKKLFDEYAARFDHHLVETLGYSMPRLLREEIDRLAGPDARFRNVIDLGCGTGLAGVAFRPVSLHLSGVDLSPRMIERAKARNVYDTLHTGDIITILQQRHTDYDLLVCADVFPYIGDVRPLFSAVRDCARHGALFAFSTETHTGNGYVLRPTGRYAHAPDYLRTAAANHGFSVRLMRTENLRKQKEEWILGDLVILQRRE